MRKLVIAVTLAAFAACGYGGMYGNEQQERPINGTTGLEIADGKIISAGDIESGVTSSVISTWGYNQLTLEIDFEQADASAVSYYCESARNASAGPWFRFQSASVSSGTATMSDLAWTKTVSGNDEWVTSADINYKYARCVFSATGAGTNGDDTVTVYGRLGNL